VRSFHRSWRRALVAWRRALVALLVLAPVGPAIAGTPPVERDRTTIVTGTLEAAIGQPMVHVQLRDGKRVLTGKPTELAGLLGGDDRPARSFPAYLDTGAGGFVISGATAERFGIAAVAGAEYMEVGLHGDVAMGVSAVYQLGLAGVAGDLTHPDGEFTTVAREVTLLLSRTQTPPELVMIGATIDVVGMPAIAKLVVEIVPAPAPRAPAGAARPGDLAAALAQAKALMTPPTVRLHEGRKRPRMRNADLVIPLEMIDFNRPRQRGKRNPRPSLEKNPMVTGIVASNGGIDSTGDWLLDTGATASIISTAQAKTLGLLDAAGQPTRPPDFELPLGGVGGAVRTDPGFIVDRIVIAAKSRRFVEFRRVHVVVRDVTIERKGVRTTLDGILGMNLLLPSASGLADGMPTAVADAPFARIWIDGPRRRLALERAAVKEDLR